MCIRDRFAAVKSMRILWSLLVLTHRLWTVSYTHLDVYKRQVRIPVPHFIFGDDPAFCDPYVPCIEYLDKAFDWADETGLKLRCV